VVAQQTAPPATANVPVTPIERANIFMHNPIFPRLSKFEFAGLVVSESVRYQVLSPGATGFLDWGGPGPANGHPTGMNHVSQVAHG